MRAALAAAVPVTLGILGRRWLTPWSHPTAAPPQAPLPGLDKFAPLVGSQFTVASTAGQRSFSLTLAKAETLKGHQAGVAERFSLRFTPPAGHRIESQIYELTHPTLGRLELFLCPVGAAGRFHEDQKGEAIISFDRPAAWIHPAIF